MSSVSERRFLSIAGLDDSGGAGIDVDLQVATDYGVTAKAIVTARTEQSSSAVRAVEPTAAEVLQGELRVVGESEPPAAVKIGMLANQKNLEAVAEWLASVPEAIVVWDPVLQASSGGRLFDGEPVIKSLMSCINVITPNIPEMSRLAGVDSDDSTRIEEAAEALSMKGPDVVLTGGHQTAGDRYDLICHKGSSRRVPFKEIVGLQEMRGTGCRFSSALACELMSGQSLESAVSRAGEYVRTCFRRFHTPGST